MQADLSAPGWEKRLPQSTYSIILAFAVLHHIPSQTLRLEILKTARRRLAPGALFIHSEWQFLNSPRLHARIVPWEAAGIPSDQVEAGDYLIDWRAGGTGLRYVHSFTEAELSRLAAEAGFAIQESFYADGENGRLGIYQIWKPV